MTIQKFIIKLKFHVEKIPFPSIRFSQVILVRVLRFPSPHASMQSQVSLDKRLALPYEFMTRCSALNFTFSPSLSLERWRERKIERPLSVGTERAQQFAPHFM